MRHWVIELPWRVHPFCYKLLFRRERPVYMEQCNQPAVVLLLGLQQMRDDLGSIPLYGLPLTRNGPVKPWTLRFSGIAFRGPRCELLRPKVGRWARPYVFLFRGLVLVEVLAPYLDERLVGVVVCLGVEAERYGAH